MIHVSETRPIRLCSRAHDPDLRRRPRLGSGKSQNQGRRTRVIAQGAGRAGARPRPKSDKPAKAKRETESRLLASKSQGKLRRRARPQDRKAATDKTGKPSAPKSSDAGKVSPKDQALDELLGKLGETKDEPTAEDRPRNGRPGGEPSRRRAARKRGADKLGGKDKDLDERLEELTGRKKKRPSCRSRAERAGRRNDQGNERRRSSGWASPIPVKTPRRSKSRSSSASKP